MVTVRLNLSPSTDFETMASHDAGVVYFTEYLSVLFQLTYLDELYGECSACTNSGYQALFSPITRAPGNEASIPQDPCNTSGYLALFSPITERLGTRLAYPRILAIPVNNGCGICTSIHVIRTPTSRLSHMLYEWLVQLNTMLPTQQPLTLTYGCSSRAQKFHTCCQCQLLLS